MTFDVAFPAEATNENDTTLSAKRTTKQTVVLTCHDLADVSGSRSDTARTRKPKDCPASRCPSGVIGPTFGAVDAVVWAGKEEW